MKISINSSNVKIEINGDNIKQKVEQAFQQSLPKLSELILTDCNKYCRHDNGILIESGHAEDGGARIVYDTLYAKRVYYTGTPRTHMNLNASLLWCEVARKKHQSQWTTQANKLLKEHL